MKKFLLFFLCYCAYGQVAIDVKFDNNDYVPYEPIKTRVKIYNNTNTDLVFNKKNYLTGFLKFEIRRGSNSFKIKPNLESFNPLTNVTIPAGRMRYVDLVLNRHYIMSTAGEYKIRAIVTHPLFDKKSFASKYQFLTVNKSVPIAGQSFGVLKTVNGKDVIESRKYSILSVSNKTEGKSFCLKIYDDNYVYYFSRIGRDFQGVVLKHALDGFNNIHILLHDKGKVYRYLVYSSIGILLQNKHLIARGSVPTMIKDHNLGTIKILNANEVE